MINLKIEYKKHFLSPSIRHPLNINSNGILIGTIKSGEVVELKLSDKATIIHFEEGYTRSNYLLVQPTPDTVEIEVDTWLHGMKLFFIIFFLPALANLYNARIKQPLAPE